ncbi:hypothetical protein TNCV_3796331 [Trichonephila clavipes]|nr:hypothetical protein TNCV_3796331 [Trichonephila clavipes]
MGFDGYQTAVTERLNMFRSVPGISVINLFYGRQRKCFILGHVMLSDVLGLIGVQLLTPYPYACHLAQGKPH